MTAAARATGASHPDPLRFGLRALLIFVTLCGFQFALVARFGALVGFGAGLLIAGLLICGILFYAIVFAHRHGTPAMDRLDRLAIRATVASVVIFMGTFVAGGGALVYREVAELRMARQMSKDLGFSHLPIWAVEEGRVVRVIRVTGIDPAGEFAGAGVQVGDVIDAEMPPGEYFAMLEKNRGREVNLTVASGAELQPLEKCTRRTVTIVVPIRR